MGNQLGWFKHKHMEVKFIPYLLTYLGYIGGLRIILLFNQLKLPMAILYPLHTFQQQFHTIAAKSFSALMILFILKLETKSDPSQLAS